MRVLYVIETLGKGGAEMQLSLIADRLRIFGHSSSVVALSGGGWWGSYLQERGIPVSILKFKSGIWPKNLRQFCRLVSAIRHQRPDVVISFLYPCSIWASLAARLAKAPVVIATRRDTGFQRAEAPLPRWLEALSYSATTVFVANSRAVAESLRRYEGINANKTKIIYNGVDLPSLHERDRFVSRQQFGFPDSTAVVGMVANFWPWKNHLMLVRAAALAVAQVGDVGFVLAGRYDEYQRQVEAEIARLNLQSHFHIAGPVHSAADLLPLFDIGVLCSLPHEGFSNAILEYMAYGKPVIATRGGGNPEAVVDQMTGFLVESGDTDGLASAMLKLIRDPSKRAEMGKRGRARVAAEFNWDIALSRWDELLRSPSPGEKGGRI